jgi:hypothetical protein
VNHSRIENISDEIFIAFIYGSRTNIDNSAAQQILHQRGSTNTCIKVIKREIVLMIHLYLFICLDYS